MIDINIISKILKNKEISAYRGPIDEPCTFYREFSDLILKTMIIVGAIQCVQYRKNCNPRYIDFVTQLNKKLKNYEKYNVNLLYFKLTDKCNNYVEGVVERHTIEPWEIIFSDTNDEDLDWDSVLIFYILQNLT